MNTEVSETVYLVQEAKRGNREALNQLFERFAPFVRSVITLRKGGAPSAREDVDDLVQDALTRAFEGLGNFGNGPEQNFRAWISLCARCAIYDDYRRKRALRRGGGRRLFSFTDLDCDYFSSSIFAGDDISPSKMAVRLEREQALLDALGQLEPRHRQVILLRKLCEMSYREVAVALSVNENNARQLVYRALEKLRALMGEEEQR